MSKPAPRRLLFVCTGNICRSPMAEFMADRLAREAGLPWSAASAGVAAEVGWGMTDEAARALGSRGIGAAAHEARQLDAAMLAAADDVYVMTRAHLRSVVAGFPEHAKKVALLREAAGLTPAEIADPYGGSQAVYEACAASIEEALKILIRRKVHA